MITGRPVGYGDHMRRRLVARLGITGLWQVNGRSTCPWTRQSGWTGAR